MFLIAAIGRIAVAGWVVSRGFGVIEGGGWRLVLGILRLRSTWELWGTGSGGFCSRGWRRVDSHAVHEVTETIPLAVCLATRVGCFGTLDGAEELTAFFAAVVDEGFDVFAERIHGVVHFGVEALGAHEAVDEVVESLEDFAVARKDGVTLTGE